MVFYTLRWVIVTYILIKKFNLSEYKFLNSIYAANIELMQNFINLFLYCLRRYKAVFIVNFLLYLSK